LGDTWKMLKWQFSGRMGGNRKDSNRTGGDGFGDGRGTPMPPAQDLVSPDGTLRVL
jgi:hypothetical protein